MFRNRLVKVFRHLHKQAKRQNITCYRIYDHDLPEFPFCIELYNKQLYVAEYRRHHGMDDEQHAIWLQKSMDVMSEVIAIDSHDIHLRLRQRKPGRSGQYKQHDEKGEEFIVEENGLKFIVNLKDYLDTGLFLDHRLTRQMVREQSKDKKVLNLFAYTGSFSVYVAAGGAVEVVTVDLSKTYLAWAQRNMQLNGFDDPLKYRFVHADVMQFIKTLPENHFDIIVLDPPTFSNSKRMDDFMDIEKDHVGMINVCMNSLQQGGKLYFSTNKIDFKLNEKEITASAIKDITKATTGFDFERKLLRYCFLITK
ncbi:MAG: class I SAM-dependent methyltransferase [Chitinophagales bacterium]|nr:class I SAM-dependent methyltransferase [Chitinophagales bacterium]